MEQIGFLPVLYKNGAPPVFESMATCCDQSQPHIGEWTETRPGVTEISSSGQILFTSYHVQYYGFL